MQTAVRNLVFKRRLKAPVAGIGTHLADIEAMGRNRFGRFRQQNTALFAMGKFRKVEHFAVGAFDRFGFGRFTAAAIRITGPAHGGLQAIIINFFLT